ncbi:MAG: hypothetical protein IPM46_05730 [Flavobacteriales bacterium]|nr:hypothetical protein [Flavobacteriales bacterium]
MKRRTIRRWVRLLVISLVLVVAGFLGVRWLEHAVLKRSERILTGVSGSGSSVSFGSVDIHLLRGDVKWSDLRITQPAAEPDTAMGDRAMRVSGQVHEIAVQGLSVWRLLFGGTLSMRSISVIRPDIEVILMNDSTTAAQRPSVDLTSLNADRLVIEGAVLRMHRTGDSLELRVDTLGLQVLELRSQWGGEAPFDLRFASATSQVQGIRATLPPLYDLRVGSVSLDDEGRLLRVVDVDLKPRNGPQRYHHLVRFETDLFDAQMDTAMLAGLDLPALISSRILRMDNMRCAGVALNVYRDKTMPDEPFLNKPLPARMIRELPMAVCMDSLVADRWNVRYHEKNELTPDYGEVAFSDIHAVVVGLCSVDSLSTDTMVISAIARGYDKADVTLDLRTVISDRTDRFTAKATIGRLPFTVFNQMTADLMLVRAKAGTIRGVVMTMDADKDRATGRADMTYEGLDIELIRKDGSGETRKFLSSLVNLVVHSRNKRSGPDFRHGDFAVDRRKDRSVFNYLWSGLREGIVATALPGVLQDLRQGSEAKPTQ